MSAWRFVLPPSLGKESARACARELASVLYDAGFTRVWPETNYASLEARLLAGETDAAWGPPLVCGRVELAGGAVVLRSIRWGASTYRSAILCRAADRLDLRELSKTRRKPRAVWVDEQSMSGYVLPRAHLRSIGVDLDFAFVSEEMLGSFGQCLEAVLEGEADVTAIFAAAAGSTRRAVGGHVELCGERAFELRVLGHSAECPSDGIVLSPKLSPGEAAEIGVALRRLMMNPSSSELLAKAFDVDGFQLATPGAYRDVLKFL